MFQARPERAVKSAPVTGADGTVVRRKAGIMDLPEGYAVVSPDRDPRIKLMKNCHNMANNL